MGFIRKYIKKVRNLFHIPGEDVILLGFDDRNHSLRLYDLFIKTGPKFESKLESKVIEGNVAQTFIWYARKQIDHIFQGHYDENDPNILHIEFQIDKREGCIFKTEDKPEGVAYLVDMQVGQGAQLIRKTKKTSLFEGDPEIPVETKEIADQSFNAITIPQQIKIKRDPVIELLYTVNPYLFGSAIDSVFVGELLRGRVEFWKTALIGGFCLIMGLLIGKGM